MLVKILLVLVATASFGACSTGDEKSISEEVTSPEQGDSDIGDGEMALGYQPKTDAENGEKPADQLPTETKVQQPQQEAPENLVQVANDSSQSKSSADSAALPVEEGQEIQVGKDFTVSAELLNVRSGPSMSFAPSRVVKQGTNVKMLDREGIWVKIGPEEFVSIKHLTDAK